LRALEDATVETLKGWSVEARSSPVEMKIEGIEPTGVWVGKQKIASLGIAIRRWVTFHGIALNADRQGSSSSLIWACGYRPGTMTSVEEMIGPDEYTRRGSREALTQDLLRNVLSRLEHLSATQREARET
jgi:lipoate-protein ligase B